MTSANSHAAIEVSCIETSNSDATISSSNEHRSNNMLSQPKLLLFDDGTVDTNNNNNNSKDDDDFLSDYYYFIDFNHIDPRIRNKNNNNTNDTESLFNVTKILQNQFEKDGFVCCRNVLKNMEQWTFEYYCSEKQQQQQQQCEQQQNEQPSITYSKKDIPKKCYNLLNQHEQFFNDIFITLHTLEHIPFPHHCQFVRRLQTSDDESGMTSASTDVTPTAPQDPSSISIDYAMGIGIKNGFREIVMRSPGRYEVSLWNDVSASSSYPSLSSACVEPSGNNENSVTNTPIGSLTIDDYSHSMIPLLDDLKQQLWFVPNLLATKQQQQEQEELLTWDDVHIINVSFVVATPYCTEQAWHADGGHINLQNHEPCHVLNIFIPLCTITPDMGPTELRPGSHYYTRNLTKLLLLAKIKKTIRPTVTPLLSIGDILIFDYRILHRGQANKSSTKQINNNTNRTYLVVTVAQKWYHDRLNFPQRSLFSSYIPNQKIISE